MLMMMVFMRITIIIGNNHDNANDDGNDDYY